MADRISSGIPLLFRNRIDCWIDRTQLTPSAVRIRDMNTRWAVCHVDGSITFARALLDQPAAFQDLVIAHELLHLCIPDHSEWFFLALTMYLPDWRATATLAPETPTELTQSHWVRDSVSSVDRAFLYAGASNPA